MGDKRAGPVIGPGRVRLILAAIAADVFIVNTVAFMLAPLLLPIAAELGTTVALVGQLAAVTSIPWAVAGFFAGPLSDRWGRRPLLFGGTAILGLGTIAGGLTGSYGALLATRLFSGLGASTIGPNALTVLGDIVPANRRGAALGWIMSGQSLATVAGVPLVSLIAGLYGWRAAFWGVGVAVLLVLIALVMALPGGTQAPAQGISYLRSFGLVARNRTAMMAMLANLLERTAYGVFSVYLASFLAQSYGLDLREVAPVLSFVAIGMLTGMVVGGRLTDRLPKRALAGGAPIALGLTLIPLFLFTPGIAASTALGFLAGVLTALSRPVFMWFATNIDPSLRGTLAGITTVSNQSGVILGSALGGLLLGAGSYAWLGWLGAAAGLAAGLTALLMTEPGVVDQ